ncbi:MAG: hypothetical protein WAQ33_14930 [Gaiellaceae bacterium]
MSRRMPKWFMPLFSLGLGVACLVAFWIGDNLRQGLFSLALLGGVGAVFAVGGRSETIRGLRGDGRDEYWYSLDRDATLLAGMTLILVLIGLCFWEWAHGRDGSPYAQLAAIGGATYIAAYIALRMRR